MPTIRRPSPVGKPKWRQSPSRSGEEVGRAMRADAVRNREALGAAARSVFLEHGCDAPLDEVAKRACVGAGTLYRHFPTRSDLLAAVYVDDIQTLCDDIEKLGGTMDPEA